MICDVRSVIWERDGAWSLLEVGFAIWIAIRYWLLIAGYWIVPFKTTTILTPDS